MKALLLIISLAAIGSTSASARADDLIDEFRNICLSTNGDPESADTAAQNAGWQPLPADQAKLMYMTNFPAVGATNTHSLSHSTKDNSYMAIIGHVPHFFPSEKTAQPLHGNVCAIVAKNGPPAGFQQEVSSLVGVPLAQLGGRPTYVWRNQDGKRLALDPNSRDFRESMKNEGGVYLLVAASEGITRITLTQMAQ
jgi:hypothetical protein